jgi:hypothetical protein
MTDEKSGRERIEQRDRQGDAGEKWSERVERDRELDDPDDPANRARRNAAESNVSRDTGGGGAAPGTTPEMEEWEREKRLGGELN